MIGRLCLSPLIITLSFGLLGLLANLAFYSDWGYPQTIYSLGLAAFAIGYVIVRLPLRLWDQGSTRIERQPHRANKYVLKLYWALGIAGAALANWIMVTRGLQAERPFFVALRYAHTVQDAPTFGSAHLALFTFALALYYLYVGRRRFALVALMLSLIPEFAFMQRTGILFKIGAFTYLGFWFGLFRWRHLLYAGAVFMALAVFVAAVTGKLRSGGGFFLIPYIGYGLESFDTWIEGSGTYECYRVLFGNVLGNILDVIVGGECARIPTAPKGVFNVYTYISNPYLVWGAAGVIGVMFGLGFFYSILYTAARRVGGLFIFVLSILVYPLVMVFYAWQFHLSVYVYMMIIFIPLFAAVKNAKRCQVAYG